ncbi:LysR family glycine cleavage system transcriptional activator [Inhella inkyongensis]|uniref:LysR family glycine cleavage system transcriptional activator n=1 Tax=Inhella inkyongensis TaxID=392593 RepID=A0A840S3J2_9BURK|nr:LysR substrate-binding domain-containing protein [Inhella inkyongensis]MBB5203130.1 LysR family glycine cleavage system transcriptional activator [Inhella inkyongensis]
MNARTRPLAVGPLRAFEAVARLLNFRAAAEELHLTQPAISRQIKLLEEELGVALFLRGTRHVALTGAGHQLLAATLPLLTRLDRTVRQLRQDAGRQVIHLSTFASFASLWLLPRLEAFQRQHPHLDIRISANDQVQDLEAAGFDLALGYFVQPPRGSRAEALFGEVLTPVHSPARELRAAEFNLPPLREPADLAGHTLAEEDDDRPANVHAKWRGWLSAQGLPDLQPRRWLLLNFTHQQVQAALSGQAVALARLPLVLPQLTSGELIESFGPSRRLSTPAQYFLRVSETSQARPEVQHFCDWLRSEAALTRAALKN